jgi:translation initiation factor 3 subunit C
MAGAKAMSNGDWKAAIHFIHSIKVWDSLINSEKVKEMLAR